MAASKKAEIDAARKMMEEKEVHITTTTFFSTIIFPFFIGIWRVSALVQCTETPLKPNGKTTHAERNCTIPALYHPPLFSPRPKILPKNPMSPQKPSEAASGVTVGFGGPAEGMQDAEELGWHPDSNLGRTLLVLVHPRRVPQQPQRMRMRRGADGIFSILLLPVEAFGSRMLRPSLTFHLRTRHLATVARAELALGHRVPGCSGCPRQQPNSSAAGATWTRASSAWPASGSSG